MKHFILLLTTIYLVCSLFLSVRIPTQPKAAVQPSSTVTDKKSPTKEQKLSFISKDKEHATILKKDENLTTDSNERSNEQINDDNVVEEEYGSDDNVVEEEYGSDNNENSDNQDEVDYLNAEAQQNEMESSHQDENSNNVNEDVDTEEIVSDAETDTEKNNEFTEPVSTKEEEQAYQEEMESSKGIPDIDQKEDLEEILT